MQQLAERKDREWYRTFVIPGSPKIVSRIKNEPPEHSGEPFVGYPSTTSKPTSSVAPGYPA